MIAAQHFDLLALALVTLLEFSPPDDSAKWCFYRNEWSAVCVSHGGYVSSCRESILPERDRGLIGMEHVHRIAAVCRPGPVRLNDPSGPRDCSAAMAICGYVIWRGKYH